MAPEQAMGVTPLDKRADIYSLTAVTYAMLTGHPPFLVRNIADILARDISKPPEPIAERLGAPVTLDAVMLSGLAADRNRRPPTALLLADALQAIAGQMDPSGGFPQVPDAGVVTHQSPHTQPPIASEITRPDLPPVSGVDPSTRSAPAYQAAPPPFTSSYLSSGDPYAMSQLTTSPPEATTTSRPASYYVLLAVAALALFAISMFVTILVLR
jgi:serine/threonine protein kinase